jgi:hypothetical protein
MGAAGAYVLAERGAVALEGEGLAQATTQTASPSG